MKSPDREASARGREGRKKKGGGGHILDAWRCCSFLGEKGCWGRREGHVRGDCLGGERAGEGEQ